MKHLYLLLCLLPLGSLAQNAPAWGGGVGVGNGVEVHAGRQQRGWLALARVRYRWWRPGSGPGSSFLDDVNTKSRQLEVAAMAGYGVPLGRTLLYGGTGLSYLYGRHLGDCRYTAAYSGLVGSRTYYYAYRDYQALGLPLEIGWLSPPRQQARLGLAFQANFNPERTLFGGMLTLWLGHFGDTVTP
ncbi:hypothetical protein HHL22_23030 [Hymenobacter sp. RP-2-7]|uniref:Outer membrane protein beta-barrel domain-containing protein n=1 Tax=Hymenobacter polaris TaxID=2682546 RepID=A0A7Y0FPJ3_9BACT|nr:hypothetical protein [Hymenobacter polaris]NML68083.1 hypothetical protein [Hymenobacter polaris]